MKWFLLVLFIPFVSFAETTKPTSFQAKYGHMFTWDVDDQKTRIGDGVYATFEFPERRTRFSLGLYHSGYDTQWSQKEPLNIGVAGEAQLGDISLDLNITVNDGNASYRSKTDKDINDLVMMGDYGYYGKYGKIKKGNTRLDKTWALDLYATGGVKLSIATEATKYEIFVADKLVDTLVNPLAGSNISGLKFFLGHTAAFRFSHAVVDVVTVFSIPEYRRSMITINIGMAL